MGSRVSVVKGCFARRRHPRPSGGCGAPLMEHGRNQAGGRSRCRARPALLLLAALLLLPGLASAAPAPGVVTVLKGKADKQHRQQGDWRRLARRDPVASGDRVRTRAASLAEVTLHRGKQTIRLGPNSLVDFSAVFAEGERTVSALTLEEGDLWAEVDELGEESSFDLSSKAARATVRGTIFSVHADEEGTTTLNVYRGKVEVRGAPSPAAAGGGAIAGPREVAGPREITLHQWVRLVGRMQQIVVDRNGGWRIRDIDAHEGFTARWMEWNRSLTEADPTKARQPAPHRQP
ncbi:MAG: hypothetical protein D6682_02450 [Zetaproteobacteria bacterium]|nr:MAG: hypothetical protein D6682_02450 [Zetaproteobacteria bacterium]